MLNISRALRAPREQWGVDCINDFEIMSPLDTCTLYGAVINTTYHLLSGATHEVRLEGRDGERYYIADDTHLYLRETERDLILEDYFQVNDSELIRKDGDGHVIVEDLRTEETHTYEIVVPLVRALTDFVCACLPHVTNDKLEYAVFERGVTTTVGTTSTRQLCGRSRGHYIFGEYVLNPRGGHYYRIYKDDTFIGNLLDWPSFVHGNIIATVCGGRISRGIRFYRIQDNTLVLVFSMPGTIVGLVDGRIRVVDKALMNKEFVFYTVTP